MFKIDLTIYKTSRQYFKLFDILLKDKDLNKDSYLKKINVSPSSYRKARTIEQNIGNKIIERLSKDFNYKKVSSEFVTELEELFNKVYYDMYYKIFKNFDEYLKTINNMLEGNYIIFPIINLLKLFLLANLKVDVEKNVNDNYMLYEDIKKYSSFFNDDLIEIMDILALAFEKKLPDTIMFKTYRNSLAYFCLSSRLCSDKRYAECLFIARKAEEALVREKNYKRLLYLNIKMMLCLNSIECYQECYDLASMQLLTIQSFVDTDFEYNYTTTNLAVCCLALKKFEYISKLLLSKKKISLTEICCLLVANYNIDDKEYKDLYDYYYSLLDLEGQTIIKGLNNYLENGYKSELAVLENKKIIVNLTQAIRIAQKK